MALQPRGLSPTIRQMVIPAPVGGMDARMNLASADMNTCIYAYNLIPAEVGLEVRSGFKEWVVGLTGAGGVRTIIPVTGSAPGTADDRLFAATEDGIWDVSTEAGIPVLVEAFPSQSFEAGFGSYTHYVDQSGDEFLFYADGANGLYEYELDTDTWAPASGITGPTLTSIIFAVVHKQRLWLVEKEGTIAWYLPIGSKSGQATEFFFGGKFRHGGTLVGLYNWTIDGGDGVDDYLVAVSAGGDVIPYQGGDPSSALTWGIVGTYYIGATPTGTRAASEFGGDLRLLSVYGMVSMTELISGVNAKDPPENSAGFKIARIIRTDMTFTRSDQGWEMRFLPGESLLIISQPSRIGRPRVQYVYNVIKRAWGIWRGVPAQTFDSYGDYTYLGTEDGRVLYMTGDRDEVKITPDFPPPAFNGVAVEFALLTQYSHLGTPSQFKRGVAIRIDYLSTSFNRPGYTTRFKYDYDLCELIGGGFLPDPPPTSGSLWDIGEWDNAIWDNGEDGLPGSPPALLSGSRGMGRTIAVAVKGSALGKTILLSFDIMWNEGGPI